jgi:hypothetical protein
MRAPGLWHLLQRLEETGTMGEASKIVRQWADHSTKLRREARGLERRYFAHRNWFYHNLTLELCRRYRQIIVKTHDRHALGEKETEGDTPGPQQLAKYRQLASLSRFVAFLQYTAVKTGTDLQEVNVPDPPGFCPVCGTRAQEDPGAMFLMCPNRHRWDQSRTAARDLLLQATPAA